MYKIGEFSKLSGMSIDTLYHYEKMRVLLPCRIDPFTGYRYYEAKQLIDANKIIALKDANLSLEEIAEIVNSGISTQELIEVLENKAQMLATYLINEENRLERLRANIFHIKNGGPPQLGGITIKKVEEILVASIRRIFPKKDFDENLEEMWADVNNCLDKENRNPSTPCFMLYHSGWWNYEQCNITSAADHLHVEVAEPIITEFKGNNDVLVYKLPKVDKMASAVHYGSFATIGMTTDMLFNWIIQNKYLADGPIREIYHKGDWITEDPDKYITEIQVPVKELV